MTDQELKDLVASLAITSDCFDEQIKETSAQMKETDKFLSAKFAQTREEMKKTDEQMKKTDEQMKQTDEQIKQTDEQMKQTDEKLKRMGIHLSGISHNNGDMAEEFFYRSLQKKLRINNIQYDDIGRNWLKNREGITEEYDIILTNGKALEIVEVKYKVHPDDLDKLERKKNNFKKLFPVYADFTVHASIAGMTIPEEVIEHSKKRGFHTLVAKGDHIEEIV